MTGRQEQTCARQESSNAKRVAPNGRMVDPSADYGERKGAPQGRYGIDGSQSTIGETEIMSKVCSEERNIERLPETR